MSILPVKKIAVALGCCAAIGSVSAAPIPSLNVALDGSLSEWGVTLLNNNQSNLNHNLAPGDSSQACIQQNNFFQCEDTDDLSNSYYVSPVWGGQNYDVEFLGMAMQGNILYFGIGSGLRPDNGLRSYSPGDLFLRINGNQYVIEMGGGVAGATGGTHQVQGSPGSYYVVENPGTVGGSAVTLGTNTLNNQVAGSVWSIGQGTTTNGIGLIGAYKPVQFEAANGQTPLGIAQLFATLNETPASYNQHSVWELAVDLSIFGIGAGQPFNVDEARWGPACYNDVLAVSSVVPEPGTLALLGLGLLGIGVLRRRG